MFGFEIDIIILVILLFLSGFFSSSEIALVSLNRVRVRKMIRDSVPGAKSLETLRSNPHKMLVTILIGNNLVNIFAAVLATSVAMEIFDNSALGIATGVMTFLILVFGEITPKSIALAHAEKLALIIAKPLLVLAAILTPVIWILDAITGLIIPIFGGAPLSKAMTEDEIRTAVTMGAEEGAINKQEKEMIHRVLQFNDTTTAQVMTPRTEMVSIDADKKLSDFVDIFENSPFSRIPVYEKSEDKIVGILYAKDAINYLKGGKKNGKIKKLMRPAYFVPENKKLDVLLKEFQKKHIHIAIVVDEYGGVEGLVTLEDLLEELVGDIIDELEKEPKIEKINDRTIEVEGSLELEKINSLLNTRITSKSYDTIGGYILEKLGRLPKNGEAIRGAGFEIKVEKISGPRIKLVRITKK